jgi:hypothetical protein
MPSQYSVATRALIGLAAVVIVAGFFVATIVPFSIATAKAVQENTSTTRKKMVTSLFMRKLVSAVQLYSQIRITNNSTYFSYIE